MPPPHSTRYKCGFPGCTKRYASTDGVRKHARKSHTQWLAAVDEQSVLRDKQLSNKPSTYCIEEHDVEDGPLESFSFPGASSHANVPIVAAAVPQTLGGMLLMGGAPLSVRAPVFATPAALAPSPSERGSPTSSEASTEWPERREPLPGEIDAAQEVFLTPPMMGAADRPGALTPFALEESSVLHAKAAALAFNLAPPAKMPVYAEAAPEAAPADPLDLASNVPEDAVADPMNDAQCDEFVHALFAF